MDTFLPHAAVRAKERYGIDLNLEDVRHLARRCNAGEGLQETEADGTQRHVLVVGDRMLWIVYRPPGEGRPKDGLVVTITPPDVRGVKRQAAFSIHHKFRRLGGRQKRSTIHNHRGQYT